MTNPAVTMGVITLAIIGAFIALVALVGARKEIRVADVLMIGPFFLLVGACTPIGEGVKTLLLALGSRFGS